MLEHEIGRHSSNDHVQRDQPFQPIEQPRSASPLIGQNRKPCERIKELRLHVRVNRPAAIHQRVPEGPDVLLHATFNESGERQMKCLDIKRNMRCEPEQMTPIEEQGLENKNSEGERLPPL